MLTIIANSWRENRTRLKPFLEWKLRNCYEKQNIKQETMLLKKYSKTDTIMKRSMKYFGKSY